MKSAAETERGAWARRLHLPALRAWALNESETAMLAAILATAVIVYLRSLSNGWVYDDFPEIVKNRHLADWSFIWNSVIHDSWWFRNPSSLPQSAYYRPLQNAWLAINFHLFGKNPIGWHLAKIALQAAAVALSFRAAMLLSGDTVVGLIAALLFATIPVHVEPVVWASAVPEPLASAFELGALCLYLDSRTGPKRLRWYSTALFACAAFTHESAILFPVIIALYEFLLGNREGWRRRAAASAVAAAPFFAVAAIYIGARLAIFGPADAFGVAHRHYTTVLSPQRHIVMEGHLENHSLAQLMVAMPNVFWNYVKVIALPWLAGPAHPVAFARSVISFEFIVPAIIVAALAFGCYMAFEKTRRGSLYVFCAAWFVIGLLPAMNFDQVIALVQDRYLYFASFGWCLALATMICDVAASGAVWRRVAYASVSALAIVYAVVAIRIQPLWANNLAMFSASVARVPDSVHYREQLAHEQAERGELTGAIQTLRAAERISPHSDSIHYMLGDYYLRAGNKEESKREFDQYVKEFAPWALPKAPNGPNKH